jgi:hypothetical protein
MCSFSFQVDSVKLWSIDDLQYYSGTLKDLHNLFNEPIINLAVSKKDILQFSVSIYKLIIPPFIIIFLNFNFYYYNIIYASNLAPLCAYNLIYYLTSTFLLLIFFIYFLYYLLISSIISIIQSGPDVYFIFSNAFLFLLISLLNYYKLAYPQAYTLKLSF